MRSLSIYINTLFWGKSVVILIQNILDIIFFLASGKSKYQRAICCWGGSLGHTGNSSIHLESTCRGSRGELLALPHSVLLQMCKTSSGKLSNGSQDLAPWGSCCRAQRGFAGWRPQSPCWCCRCHQHTLPLAGVCKGFVLLRCEPEPKYMKKYCALVWDFRSFSSWWVSFPNWDSAWVAYWGLLWLCFSFWRFLSMLCHHVRDKQSGIIEKKGR